MSFLIQAGGVCNALDHIFFSFRYITGYKKSGAAWKTTYIRTEASYKILCNVIMCSYLLRRILTSSEKLKDDLKIQWAFLLLLPTLQAHDVLFWVIFNFCLLLLFFFLSPEEWTPKEAGKAFHMIFYQVLKDKKLKRLFFFPFRSFAVTIFFSHLKLFTFQAEVIFFRLSLTL